MSERWQQVKEILQSALERAPDEHERFLDEVCGGDRSLHARFRDLTRRVGLPQ